MTTTKQSYPKTIRFTSKKQKDAAKKLAAKSNQSLNGWLLSYVDEQIRLDIEKHKK